MLVGGRVLVSARGEERRGEDRRGEDRRGEERRGQRRGPGTPTYPTDFGTQVLSPRYEFGPAVSFDPEARHVVTRARRK